MRLVRLDHLPVGRSLELDAHLTVLLGAPQEVVAAIAEGLREVVKGDPLTLEGVAELHGVIVGLKDRAFDVHGGTWVDPVLDLDAPTPLRLVGGGTRLLGDTGRARPNGPQVEITSADATAGDPSTFRGGREDPAVRLAIVSDAAPGEDPEHDPAGTTRRVAADDLVRLRAELRSLDGERAVLAREAEEARRDLDSFARATLEVALGQLEAIGSRADSAELERHRWEAESSTRRSELDSELQRLRSELAGRPTIGSDRVIEALEGLVALRSVVVHPDAAALALAGELEDLRRSSESRDEKRVLLQDLIAEAEARLAEARSDAGASRAAAGTTELPADVVRRLEEVRDEIIELEEHGGPDVAVRSRRRVDELRSEEALLLDRLGFDTYTAYVMGRPTRDADLLEGMRRDRSVARIARLADEVDRLRHELEAVSEDRWESSERERIIGDAATILGAAVSGLSRLTTVELIDLLRGHEGGVRPGASAEIVSASGRLAAALVAAGAPSPVAAADPDVTEVAARRWLDGEAERSARHAELRRRIERLERELDRLDESARRPDDGGRGADLDAEIAAIRSRVADCEARVERHERATADLANVRIRELELRDRERDLLVRISDRERLLNVLGDDMPPPSEGLTPPAEPVRLPDPAPAPVPGAGQSGVDPQSMDSLRRLVDRDASVAIPVDDEWLLLARLGELRSVGGVGAVPLLLLGVDPASPGAPALLHRVVSMSHLVQTIVVGGEGLGRWAGSLGSDVSVVRW